MTTATARVSAVRTIAVARSHPTMLRLARLATWWRAIRAAASAPLSSGPFEHAEEEACEA